MAWVTPDSSFRAFLSHPASEIKKSENLRSEKLQNKSFPNFSNFRPEFCPEFCSEFSPNFSRTFRASFRGRPEKIHQKSPPFFNAKFPGKHEKNIQEILLESRQSKKIRKSKHGASEMISLGVFSWCLRAASYSCVFVVIVP